ncbi:hypothetical protein L915_15705, partial [Phytophthora nicotianae]
RNQCPSVPREVQVSLRPPPAPELELEPEQVTDTVHSELTQAAFEMALVKLFFVRALPFVLVEAQVFREFIALVAPLMTLPSRYTLNEVLLKRVTNEIRSSVVKLINQHTYVSLVTDGWSDTNSSSIINFMVVAPGMPSVFWSS